MYFNARELSETEKTYEPQPYSGTKPGEPSTRPPSCATP